MVNTAIEATTRGATHDLPESPLRASPVIGQPDNAARRRAEARFTVRANIRINLPVRPVTALA